MRARSARRAEPAGPRRPRRSIVTIVLLWTACSVLLAAIGAWSVSQWSSAQIRSFEDRQLASLHGDLWDRITEEWSDRARSEMARAVVTKGFVRGVEDGDVRAVTNAVGTRYNGTAAEAGLSDWVVVRADGNVLVRLDDPLSGAGTPYERRLSVALASVDRVTVARNPLGMPVLVCPLLGSSGKTAGWSIIEADAGALVRRLRAQLGRPVAVVAGGDRLIGDEADRALLDEDHSGAGAIQTASDGRIFRTYRTRRPSGSDLLVAYDVTDRERQADVIGAIAISSLVCGILVLLLLSRRSIRRRLEPLRRLSDILEKAESSGDFVDQARVLGANAREDEIGALNRPFRRILGSLGEANQKMANGAGAVTTAVSQLSATATEISAASREVSAALTESVATIEAIKDSTRETSGRATSVSDLALQATRSAEDGREAVIATVEGIESIRAEMNGIGVSVMALHERSEAIGEIIVTVNELAERSNLLAINAAIEAAKAGPEGRGFTVVADEIKGLAEQSKRGTAEIRMILNSIQKDTASSVLAAERGRKAVEAGRGRAADAGASIEQLETMARDVAEESSAIRQAVTSIDASVNQVFAALAGVLSATQQNESAISDVDAALRDLRRTASSWLTTAQRYAAADVATADRPTDAGEPPADAPHDAPELCSA